MEDIYVVYWFLFIMLAGNPDEHYAVWVLIGVIVWGCFGKSLMSSVTSLTGNTRVIHLVYFPRIIFPTTAMFSTIVTTLMSSIVVIPIIVAYGFPVGPQLILIPIGIFTAGFMGMAFGLIFAPLNCLYKDVGEKLVDLYSKLTSEDVRYVGKLEVAEAAKVIENVQRDINIALVNELARIFPAMDVDVEDVLSAAATKWNFHRYTPGVGVGGHCIPVDPYYMIQRAADVGVPAGLITAARAVNRSMPSHVASVVTDLLWSAGVPAGEAKVLLLGWSYKAEVGDPRETPAEPLAATLIGKKITVGAWDPHIDSSLYPEGVVPVDDISEVDAVEQP